MAHSAPEPVPEPEPAPGTEPAPAPEPAPASEPSPEPKPPAELEPEPEVAPASVLASQPSEAAPSPPRQREWRWVWLGTFLVCVALLGLAAGVGLAVRGRSLGPSATGDTVSRPTFVIAIGPSVSPIPSASPSPVVAQSTPSAGNADYVVQPGDTLRSIAETVYGDADQWPRIYDANRELIGPDPDALQAGMRLRLP